MTLYSSYTTVFISTLALLITSAALATNEHGTPEEAQSLVKKALIFYKHNGKDKTIAALNDPQGGFIERDLYVFVHDDKGTYYAIAPKAAFIGKNLTDVRDTDGKFVATQQSETLKTAGNMWQEYDWQNPANGKVEHKRTYCEKYDGLHFCAGAYSN